jgi:nitrate reductase molybdenum cofactor assembly chaperone NarJ/NarW
VTTRQKAKCRAWHAGSSPEVRAVVMRAAALLLDYPSADQAEADARLIGAALAELPDEAPQRALREFLSWWRQLMPRDREGSYVETFDLSPRHSLHLSSWHDGDAAERSACLLRLRATYCEAGVEVSSAELPDYLPLLLEFAAAVPDAWPLLTAETEALERLRQSLAADGSPFELVVSAVVAALPPDKPPRKERP